MSTSYTSNYKSPFPANNNATSNTITTSVTNAPTSSYTAGKSYTPPKSYTSTTTNTNTATLSAGTGITSVASPSDKITTSSYTLPKTEAVDRTGTTTGQSYSYASNSKYTSPYTSKPTTTATSNETIPKPTTSAYSAYTTSPVSTINNNTSGIGNATLINTTSASTNPVGITSNSTTTPLKTYGAQASATYTGTLTTMQKSPNAYTSALSGTSLTTTNQTPTKYTSPSLSTSTTLVNNSNLTTNISAGTYSNQGATRENLKSSGASFTTKLKKSPEEDAKAVSHHFFNTYDRRRSGSIETSQLSEVLRDIYKYIGQPFMAKPEELEGLFKVLDVNSDGKVTPEDFVALSQKYLFGGSVSNISQETIKSQLLTRTEYEKDKKAASREEDKPISLTPLKEEFSKELFDATKIFESFDTEKSGYLEEDKIALVLKETYAKLGIQKEPNPQELKNYAYTLDANKSSKVSQQIFLKFLADVLQKAKPKSIGTSYKTGGYQRHLLKAEIEKAREIFNRYDIDKSGFLKTDEIPTVLKETHSILNTKREVNEDDVRQFLKAFDRNFDDKISFEEFIRLLQTPKY